MTGGRSARPPGRPVRPLQRHSLATPARGLGIRLGADLLAASGAVAESRNLRPAAPGSARKAERGRRTRLVTCVRGRLSHPCEKGAPTAVRRRSTGGKRAATPPDLRRTRHPTQGLHDCGQRQRTSPRPSPWGEDDHGSRAVEPSEPPVQRNWPRCPLRRTDRSGFYLAELHPGMTPA